MKSISYLGIAVFLLLLFSCKKPEDRSCFKSWGEDTVVEFPMDAEIGKLYLGAQLEYEIIQDSLNKIEIVGGSNVVKHVKWTQEGDKLSFSNTNKCHFIRNERKVIKVRIHCTKMYNIHFEGTEPLSTVGTLKSDYFVLFIRDGAGPVTMDVKSIILFADISHGWGNYTLSGTTDYAKIGAKSNGFCNTENLIIKDSAYVSCETVGTMRMNADNIAVKGYMKYNGILEYLGTPSSLSILNTGGGTIKQVN